MSKHNRKRLSSFYFSLVSDTELRKFSFLCYYAPTPNLSLKRLETFSNPLECYLRKGKLTTVLKWLS